jgi:hypothetical protein
MRETTGENPPPTSQAPLGLAGSVDRLDLRLQPPLRSLLLRSLVIAGLVHHIGRPRVRKKPLDVTRDVVGGGPASRTLDPRIAAPVPLVSPHVTEAPPGFRLPLSWTARCLEGVVLHFPLLPIVRSFPSNRARVLNPGDSCIPYGTLTHHTVSAAVRRDSAA